LVERTADQPVSLCFLRWLDKVFIFQLELHFELRISPDGGALALLIQLQLHGEYRFTLTLGKFFESGEDLFDFVSAQRREFICDDVLLRKQHRTISASLEQAIMSVSLCSQSNYCVLDEWVLFQERLDAVRLNPVATNLQLMVDSSQED